MIYGTLLRSQGHNRVEVNKSVVGGMVYRYVLDKDTLPCDVD